MYEKSKERAIKLIEPFMKSWENNGKRKDCLNSFSGRILFVKFFLLKNDTIFDFARHIEQLDTNLTNDEFLYNDDVEDFYKKDITYCYFSKESTPMHLYITGDYKNSEKHKFRRYLHYYGGPTGTLRQAGCPEDANLNRLLPFMEL